MKHQAKKEVAKEREPQMALVPMAPQAAMVEVQKSREIQEVQGAIISAKKFPRDEQIAFQKIMLACKRPTLAKQAMYSYPRGGSLVTGPSIRLAEVLAQSWGNLTFGVDELERHDGFSIARAYCWDLESNVRQTKTFTVEHLRKAHGRIEKLTDPRDIYEHVANYGTRRMRACMLGVMPGDIREAAVERCAETLVKGDGEEPLIDRVRKMLDAFKTHLGVSIEMIEERIGHKSDLITGAEFVELNGIYNAIKDKHSKREAFFKFKETTDDETKNVTAELMKNAEVAKSTEA